MGFFRRLFGGKKTSPHAAGAGTGDKDGLLSTADDVPCLQIDLVARWANAADMGQADKISGYVCTACGRAFSVAEAQALREQEGSRLTWMAEGDQTSATQPSDPPPGTTAQRPPSRDDPILWRSR